MHKIFSVVMTYESPSNCFRKMMQHLSNSGFLVQTTSNEQEGGEQSSIGEHLYSNGSDLYAEIGTDQNSAYSSSYARISNLSAVQLNAADTRPLPPSIETLQQLAHESLMGRSIIISKYFRYR